MNKQMLPLNRAPISLTGTIQSFWIFDEKCTYLHHYDGMGRPQSGPDQAWRADSPEMSGERPEGQGERGRQDRARSRLQQPLRGRPGGRSGALQHARGPGMCAEEKED